MRQWFLFDFDTGDLRYVGQAENFDELTEHDSGWLFDEDALRGLCEQAAKLLGGL